MQALCVCKSFPLVSEDIRWHVPVLPAWGNTDGMFNARALGQSAQAEQDNTFILYPDLGQ